MSTVAEPPSRPARRTFRLPRLMRWWVRLIRGELGRESRPSATLVGGEVFVRLPDASSVEASTNRAASESLRVASSFLRFGRARAREHHPVELAGGGTGLLLRVSRGHEDPLIERIHAWFTDELRAHEAVENSLEREPPLERHR